MSMKKMGMKKMGSMKKAMRKMAKKVSKIAKGKRARASVWAGGKVKTASGLKKSDLKKNKRGKIVTHKSSAAGRKNYKNISGWVSATRQARKELKIKGFLAIGGKTKAGQQFLAKARSIYKKSKK